MKYTHTHFTHSLFALAIALTIAGASYSVSLRAQVSETGSSLLETSVSSSESSVSSASSESSTELSSVSSDASSDASSSAELSASSEISVESAASASASSFSAAESSASSSADSSDISSDLSSSSEIISSVASSASSDRLSELRNRVIDRSDEAGTHTNIAPSFVIPMHAEIANAEELQNRVTLSLINAKGEEQDAEFSVTDEENGYRVTVIPPRIFTPGHYRLIATLDPVRGISRVLQRFFRVTEQQDDEDADIILLNELIEWGMITTNAEASDEETKDLIIVTRDSVSQAEPGSEHIMTLTIVADVGMTGTIREKVSSDFRISNVSPAGTVDQSGDETFIEWNASFTAGDVRTFSYSYTAPDADPLFALFGPVDIRGTPDGSTTDVETMEDSSMSSETSSVESVSSESSASTQSSDESSASTESSAESAALSESSASSATSNILDETVEASSESPISAFFSRLVASITFDEDEIFFTEDTQWQLLIATDTMIDQERERVLTLQRTQAVFDANTQPTFTLIDTELSDNDESILDDDGNLDDAIALEEILKTVITNQQMKDAVVTQVLKDEADAVASQTLQDRTAQETLQEAAGETTITGLQNAVVEAISANTNTQERLTGLVNDHSIVSDIVNEVIASDLEDRIIEDIAEQGTEPVDVAYVISTAVNTPLEDVAVLKEAVIGTVAGAQETVDIVADHIEEAPAAAEENVSVVQITLTDPNGNILRDVPFHFEIGSVQLVVEPIDHFTPGVYTVEVMITNPLTGEVTTMYQQFAWGVLALNADKDIYKEGETGRIDFGVLDDRGEIVCTADLTLVITHPDGSVEQLSTDDDSIETTGSCGLKEAGFIEPDFTTTFAFEQTGTYTLTLTAETPNGIRSITSTITVESANLFSIKRIGATRLWPFAPSPMTLQIEFNADVDGMIVERVPAGFAIESVDPDGVVVQNDDGSQSIRWSGFWEAGETAVFMYEYDAPDISPQFYLLGPVRILSDSPLIQE